MADSPLVLIVDDDEAVRDLLGMALERRGYRVAVSAHGGEGLAVMARESPRLVVLDYWMPFMDGAGFMARLKMHMPRRPPVILLTAATDEQILIRDLGVDVYVEKPVDLERFLKLVDTMARCVRPIDPPSPALSDPDRRVHARRPLRMAVQVRVPGRSAAPAFTTDLSEEGVGLDLRLDAPLGSHLAIDLHLPDGRRAELDARVRYVHNGRIGAQFLALDESRRALLLRLLAGG